MLKFCVILILSIYVLQVATAEEVKQKAAKNSKISKKDLYKYGFKLKRSEQIEAVKRIVKIEDYSKRYSMVKIVLEQIFKVLLNAKIKVIEFGYIPGEEFPESQAELDELGHVFENVALFGDLLLRCPDITHKLYDPIQQWQVAMNWGIVFSNETAIFDGANATLLDLVAQELDIIPRDENYINPYKEATIKAEQKRLREKEESKKRKENEKKHKKKTKKRKGPRLGGGEL